MKLLILLTIIKFGLCQDSMEASVDIVKPKPGLRDCTLPREFTVRVRTHNDSVTLQLETSTSVKKTTPVYVSRQDEKGNPIIVRDTVLELEGTAVYQDVTHVANIEVSCVTKEENQPYYLFEGLLLLSGPRMYKLKPTGTESASGDIRYTLTYSPVHIARIDNDDDGEKGQSGSDSEMMASESLRKKRQIQEPIYVDVITVIGFSVYERWYSRATQLSEALKHQETKQGLKRHFAHLVNGVDLRYKTASPLYNINLVGYIIQDKQSEQSFQSAVVNETKIDGDKLLSGTRQWKADTPGFPDNDHIIVFTAYDLFREEENRNTTDLLGYAYVGTICKTPYNSVSAVEYTDNLVDDMLVTTHEVGHALSARHDGEYNNKCNSTYKYIMTGSGYSRTHVLDHNNYYVFSTCSLHYFQTFIQGILTNGTNTQKQCLQTSLEPASVTNITGTMPGQLYDVHAQCQMMFGPGFVLRLGVDIGGSENICKRMVCGKEQLQSSRNAAEGTPCGHKKWCVAGQCVFSIDAPEQNNTDCLFGSQPIVYPQNKTCAELISATPRLCYRSYYLTVCCETCPVYKRSDENCPYGDRFINCATAITRDTKRLCYGEANANGCCGTCSAFKSSVANCTYGDHYSDCTVVTKEKKNLCYDENNAYGCCETCSAYSSGVVNCTYGDRYSDCTDVTKDKRNLCYNERNANGCCETCSAYSSPVENCTYGDRYSNCRAVTSATKYQCYNEDIAHGCCETCLSYSSRGDCPYGDNTLTDPCTESNCITSGSDYIGRCCDTCRNFVSQSTTTTTVTTTTTPPTTTATTTTPTTTPTTNTTTTATPPTTTTPSTTTTPTTTTTTTTTTTPTTTTPTTTPTTTTTTTTLPPTTTTPSTTTTTPTTTQTTTTTTTTTTPTTITTTTTPTTTTTTTTTTTPTTTTAPTTTSATTTNTPTTTTTTITNAPTTTTTTTPTTTTTSTTTTTTPTTTTPTATTASQTSLTTSTRIVSSTATTQSAPTPTTVNPISDILTEP
ncbi:uncharacterized protein, partial [Haliotis cracherodii]|uniref:uncharacterized protein n=1 Tax=Haliotis cracherodii TaxID=6455 RepID=UPI0039EA319B